MSRFAFQAVLLMALGAAASPVSAISSTEKQMQLIAKSQTMSSDLQSYIDDLAQPGNNTELITCFGEVTDNYLNSFNNVTEGSIAELCGLVIPFYKNITVCVNEYASSNRIKHLKDICIDIDTSLPDCPPLTCDEQWGPEDEVKLQVLNAFSLESDSEYGEYAWSVSDYLEELVDYDDDNVAGKLCVLNALKELIPVTNTTSGDYEYEPDIKPPTCAALSSLYSSIVQCAQNNFPPQKVETLKTKCKDVPTPLPDCPVLTCQSVWSANIPSLLQAKLRKGY